MKTGDLVLSQLAGLDRCTTDLLKHAEKSAPDGWDYFELETVDAMINMVIRQAQAVLTSIGETLKLERANRRASKGALLHG